MNASLVRADLLADPPAGLNPTPDVFTNHTDAAIIVETDKKLFPGTVGIDEILKFLMLDNEHKADDGTDTQDRPIWRRMEEVEALDNIPDGGIANPWGSSTLGNVSEIQQIKVHQLLDYFRVFASGNLAVDVTDTNFRSFVAGARNAGCMSTTQETAFNALADNKLDWGQSKGHGTLNEGDILAARNAP